MEDIYILNTTLLQLHYMCGIVGFSNKHDNDDDALRYQ